MTVPSNRAMVARLLRGYAELDTETLEAGRAWYPRALEASRAIAARYGADPAAVVGAVAALSPRIQWITNLRAAESLLADPINGGSPAFHANRAAARAILAGADPAEVLRGPKVSAFYRAILGDHGAVTVDRWAWAAATGLPYPGSGATAARVRALQDAYTRSAGRVGESPRDFQAQLWIGARGRGD